MLKYLHAELFLGAAKLPNPTENGVLALPDGLCKFSPAEVLARLKMSGCSKNDEFARTSRQYVSHPLFIDSEPLLPKEIPTALCHFSFSRVARIEEKTDHDLPRLSNYKPEFTA